MQEIRRHHRRLSHRYAGTAEHTSATGTLALRSMRSDERHGELPGRIRRSYLPIRDATTSASGYKNQYALWLESRQLREPGSRLEIAYKEHRSEPGHADELVSALRFHIGHWVAVRGSEVLITAESARDVVTFLRQRKLYADSVFRVPANPREEMGEG